MLNATSTHGILVAWTRPGLELLRVTSMPTSWTALKTIEAMHLPNEMQSLMLK